MQKKKKQPKPESSTEVSSATADKDFVLEIAELAWKDGLSTNTILKRKKWESTPQNINRVKRALQRAVRENLIQLFPPLDQHTITQLEERYGKNQFTLLRVEVDFDTTCLAMARLIADKIAELLRKNADQDIYIANAGGGTIRDIVTLLEREVPDPPPGANERLTFLSLNSAEHESRFDECANYTAVRMAQIYGAKHRASVRYGHIGDGRHQTISDDEIHLLITSAGGASEGGFLADALKLSQLDLPEEVVGDIAFMPVVASGCEAKLADEVRAFIDLNIAPTPRFANLLRYAATNRLLLVLTGKQKARVGHALILSGLARQCVINLPVAKAILDLSVSSQRNISRL